MKPETTTTLYHPRPDFQYSKAQPAPLGLLPAGALGCLLQRTPQPTRPRVPQQPHRVGQETMTTRPPAGQVEFEFLDAVLLLCALTIEVVEWLGCVHEVGDHKARIERPLGDLDFDHHPPQMRPFSGFVA